MKLAHDDDVTEYPGSLGSPPGGNHEYIEFNKDWIDEKGLPSKLHDWLLEYLDRYPRNWVQNAERSKYRILRGVRWVGAKPSPFRIRIENEAPFHVYFRAEFDMENGDTMIVEPGSISYFDTNKSRLLRRYYEYDTEDGLQWKLDMEVRRVYFRDYKDCPLIMGHAYSEIDAMLYAITRVPNKRIDFLVPMIGKEGPRRRDRRNCKVADSAIRAIYRYVSEHYHRGHETPEAPNSDLYDAFKEKIRRIILNPKVVPEPLY